MGLKMGGCLSLTLSCEVCLPVASDVHIFNDSSIKTHLRLAAFIVLQRVCQSWLIIVLLVREHILGKKNCLRCIEKEALDVTSVFISQYVSSSCVWQAIYLGQCSQFSQIMNAERTMEE